MNTLFGPAMYGPYIPDVVRNVVRDNVGPYFKKHIEPSFNSFIRDPIKGIEADSLIAKVCFLLPVVSTLFYVAKTEQYDQETAKATNTNEEKQEISKRRFALAKVAEFGAVLSLVTVLATAIFLFHWVLPRPIAIYACWLIFTMDVQAHLDIYLLNKYNNEQALGKLDQTYLSSSNS